VSASAGSTPAVDVLTLDLVADHLGNDVGSHGVEVGHSVCPVLLAAACANRAKEATAVFVISMTERCWRPDASDACRKVDLQSLTSWAEFIVLP